MRGQSVIFCRVMDGPAVSQMASKKDSKMDSAGQNRTKDIRVENFDISYGEKFVEMGSTILF